MKKITIWLVFSLLSNLILAHDIHYDKVIQRTWEFQKTNKRIKGSFNMYKNGTVFIEDEHSKIITIPFASLSKTDQSFVLQKDSRLKIINGYQAQISREHQPNESFFDRPFWLVLFFIIGLVVYIFYYAEKNKVKYLLPVLATVVITGIYGFKGKMIRAMQSTSTATLDSAFVPFKPAINTYWDANYFYVESKGIPNTHEMMVGISNHGWQRQVPIPQCYIGANAWPIPLNPVLATNPIPVDSIHFTRGAIAIAINGVPIFNVHTNTGVDSYLDGQLDNFGGHCGRADDYHYHIAPLHLYNYTTTNLPVAYGLDGYAVYGNVEPDGSAMLTLDANHGHLFNGVYHYHGTATAPYMIAKMAGNVTEDNTHQLIPQAVAHPVRPALTPLNGALITDCTPNSSNNGYCLTYTRNGLTDSVVYSWNTSGQYTFRFYTNGNLDSLKNYNGFVQCTVPTTISAVEDNSANSLLSIYPNPSNGHVSFRLNNGFDAKQVQSILIYNLQGALIYSSSLFESQPKIDHLEAGIYLVQIRVQGKQLTQKMIVR